MTTAYPLQWPIGRPRKIIRKSSTFGKKVHNGRYDETKRLTVSDAVKRLQAEVDRLGARQYVLSTNVELRLDGLPRSDRGEPRDPGVALYFHLNGKPHCMPCDTYDRVADNIAAVAAHIEATRAIARHGVATVAEMFAGFTALPPPGAAKHWSEVLGVSRTASLDEIDTAWRTKARSAHPDAGGTDSQMADINRARDEARKERS